MKLDVQKWKPWNWFNHEEESRRNERGGSSLPAAVANDPLWNIHREIDRMFRDAFSAGFPQLTESITSERGNFLRPFVDIKESRRNYKITVEVPGVEENDVKLEITDHTLTISGEKRSEKEEKEEHYHSIERSYGSFRRVLSLPEDAEEDGIEAKFKNGVLTITVPRRETARQKEETKVIPINKAAGERYK